MNQENKHFVVIMFPYSGFNTDWEGFSDKERSNQENRRENFEKLIKCCHEQKCKPLVIINKDTVNRQPPNNADQFFRIYAKNGEQDKNTETFDAELESNSNKLSFDVRQVWSVDTCQMWLAGWGHIIDELERNYEELKNYRIVQIPGDLDQVGKNETEKNDFFDNKLSEFIGAKSGDIVIGDYTTGSQFSSKDIVDIYGIFPLLANWFPDVSDYLVDMEIRKPKSEFLNLNVAVLKELLRYPKFAYEQTLNMIIQLGYSLEYEDIQGEKEKRLIKEFEEIKDPWNKEFLLSIGARHKIKKHDLGYIKDDPKFRYIQSCFDQIERTERLLKRLWRHLFFPTETAEDKQYRKFLDEYDRRIQRSDAVIETARIMIRRFIGKDFSL